MFKLIKKKPCIICRYVYMCVYVCIYGHSSDAGEQKRYVIAALNEHRLYIDLTPDHTNQLHN